MASVNDKITDVRNAARPVTTTVSSARTAGATTLACASLAGWPTASKVHFVTYQIDANSNPVAGTQLDCYGIVSGNNIGSLTIVDGTDNGNSVGDVVEMLPTAAWGQDLADALMAEHTRTGTHGAITATSVNVAAAGAVTTDTVSEKTSANGVTVDGLNIKDGKLNTNNSVVSSNITDDAITASKLFNGKIARRQGGTTGDASWRAGGTSNTDTSSTEAFFQVGTIAVTAVDLAVTFPVAFNQIPVVFANAVTAGNNTFAIISSASTTGFTIRLINDAGAGTTGETANWIAVGQ